MGRGYRGKPWAALEALEAVLKTMRALEPWTAEAIEAALRTLAEQRGEKPGVLFTPIRAATTGKRIAPPLFDTLEVLGRETTLERLNAAAEHLAPPRRLNPRLATGLTPGLTPASLAAFVGPLISWRRWGLV